MGDHRISMVFLNRKIVLFSATIATCIGATLLFVLSNTARTLTNRNFSLGLWEIPFRQKAYRLPDRMWGIDSLRALVVSFVCAVGLWINLAKQWFRASRIVKVSAVSPNPASANLNRESRTPAVAYATSADVAVLTSYFNPARYRSKLANYTRFMHPFLQSGSEVFAIECLFGDGCPELTGFPNVFTVTAESVVWQKERLLNLLLDRIPSQYTKIVWIDCDVLFCDERWLQKVSSALESFPVLQPFETAIRLPARVTSYGGKGDLFAGFGWRYAQDPGCLHSNEFQIHGHTGFVWAARREVLERCRLYDACIGGGADHVMVHAMCGDSDSPCVTGLLGNRSPLHEHYRLWAARAFDVVRGKIGFVEGSVLHLWHGPATERGYRIRNQQLDALEFDPHRDMCLGESGCWRVIRPEIEEWARKYFGSRNEDAE